MPSTISRPSSFITVLFCLIFLIGMSACGGGGGGSNGGGTNPAPTVTISASPTSVSAGASSTLTVTATNATTVVVSNNLDSTTYSLTATGGTKAVSPTNTITYTATATGAGGTASATATVTVTATSPGTVTVTISANPTSIAAGTPSTLTVAATNATTVVISDNLDSTTYPLTAAGGTQAVSPAKTITYTATATGAGGTATATATVTVQAAGNVSSINHVIFMLQENRTFDTYFGMLNPYRAANGFNKGDDGKEYDIDGIDDKLTQFTNQDDEGDSYQLFKFTTTCIDDETSAWLESYGDVNRFNFAPSRPILLDGFVHTAENYAKGTSGSGTFTDLTGRRAMGYYDQGYLNYYYYMASQFALSDRWFSPVSSKSTPNRIATYTGGTTQGLVRDPANDDHFGQLSTTTIFQELSTAGVSWKIYYSVTEDQCIADPDGDCGASTTDKYPASTFTYFTYSHNYLYKKASPGDACTGNTQSSGMAVGDPNDAFCIDTSHIAPLSQFMTDLKNSTLPAFSFIEPGYSNNDEHPGSGQSILAGQVQVASILNAFMTSASWADSVFFLSYDEGGGPFDHVPPVPGHTNDFTDASLSVATDISSIAVNPDAYKPCLADGTIHCDLVASDPGANAGDAAAQQGFAAQLGFRLPDMIVSPFARKHYVSHTPMDHTAVIKFVESRFIGAGAALTARDAAQPDLLEFFDFTNVPWASPPTPPAPVTASSLGTNPCHPADMGP